MSKLCERCGKEPPQFQNRQKCIKCARMICAQCAIIFPFRKWICTDCEIAIGLVKDAEASISAGNYEQAAMVMQRVRKALLAMIKTK